jgi:hypothetical protein
VLLTFTAEKLPAPTLKFPLLSRAIIALAVLELVAVVAEFATLPEVDIVASFKSAIAALELTFAFVIAPSTTLLALPIKLLTKLTPLPAIITLEDIDMTVPLVVFMVNLNAAVPPLPPIQLLALTEINGS